MGLLSDDNCATYETISEKLSTDLSPAWSESEATLMKQLSYGGFITDHKDSDFEQLKFRYRQHRYDSRSMGLVIAPTMACNMGCAYCFESNKHGRMTPKVVEGLIEFVEKRGPILQDFQVTWYGGEPLLALDIIEDLATAFMDLAKEYKFAFSAGGIMTNGYLLSKDNVDRIKRLQLGEIQVTIDGPARIHNQKRPLKNGKDSFHTIIENIAYAATQVSTVIRINVDKSFTLDMIKELCDELDSAGLKNKVGMFFGQLEPSTVACANIAESCYGTKSFSETEMEFYRVLSTEGFTVEKLPQPILTFCLAQRQNSFLIDSDGDLYRCFNYVGDKSKAVGNILNPVDFTHPEFLRLFSFDPFEHRICRDCSILPMCMGGCPARRSDRDMDESEYCDSWKYNLFPMLELIAHSRSQAAQRQSAEETSK